MLAIYFCSFAALFVCLRYVQAADPPPFMPSQAGNDGGIDFFLTYNCKSTATDAQIAAADKCFQAANMDFYSKIVKTVQDGTCPTSGDPSSMAITRLCKTITGKDADSRALVECVSKAYGRYPSTDKIPMSAMDECDAAKTA